MPSRLAPPFTPDVEFLYNEGATAIAAGKAVQWGDALVATEYSDPQLSGEQKKTLANQSARATGVTQNVPSIKQADVVADNNSLCGVAVDDIAATSWGWVATKGLADVYIGASANITVNDLLIVATGGVFAESPAIGTATFVHALAMEATITSGTCAAALITAFIPASGIPGDQCAGAATTA